MVDVSFISNRLLELEDKTTRFAVVRSKRCNAYEFYLSESDMPSDDRLAIWPGGTARW